MVVFKRLTEERGLDEAHIFLVADALLTEATRALHNKRVKDLAEARREANRPWPSA